MIEKPRPDILTLSNTFNDLSVSYNLFSKAGMRQFGAAGANAYDTVGNRRVNFVDFKNYLGMGTYGWYFKGLTQKCEC